MMFNRQFERISTSLCLSLLLLTLTPNASSDSNTKQHHSHQHHNVRASVSPSSSVTIEPTLTNPNVEISLLDVEPEANLMLDEHAIAKLNSNNKHKLSFNNNSAFADDTRHLALVHPANSVVIRSTFGTFFARHTIDPFGNELTNSSGSWPPQSSFASSTTDGGSRKGHHRAILAPNKQISAYLVTRQVRRSQPVLRVLFYASHLTEYESRLGQLDNEQNSLCAAVIVQFHGERLFGTCSPSKTRSNACLAQVTIPALYWPPLDVSNGGLYAAKAQKSSIAKVFYTVVHTVNGAVCDDESFLSLLEEKQAKQTVSSTSGGHGSGESVLKLVPLSDVYLVPFRGSYEEVTNDNVVTVLIPQEPVYPNSRIYIPVKYTYNPDYPVAAFSLRVQVKPGLKILGAHLSHANKLWQLRVELGPKQTTATVTAYLRDFEQTLEGNSPLPEDLLENLSQEVYSWLIEVEDGVDILEVNGRVVWQLLYNTDISAVQSTAGADNSTNFERESVKLTSLIDIQKDVVQQILPITRSREILNTAILNGRQVSRPMRIYQVSAGGVISDITFQCSCSAADESILKVSPSCTSVYLDGSEVRGSQNATVHIKYGSFSGSGSFIVWMPLIPLDVRVSDSKLSLVKGWRIPNKKGASLPSPIVENLDLFDIENDEKMMQDQPKTAAQNNPCSIRFQQARIEVYTRFLSTDHNSGREASLLNRKFTLQITHLVKNLIRVTDPKVLELRGTHIRGLSPGRADVEILSPLTGSVVGARDVHVDMDRESITGMIIKPVAGIDLDVKPVPLSGASSTIWRVNNNFKTKLTKQYQEALLDVRLKFSDGTTTFLSEIPPDHYALQIDTFKGVVAHVTRTGVNSGGHLSADEHHHSSRTSSLFLHDIPRLIALSSGSGELVHVSFRSPLSCHRISNNNNKNNHIPLPTPLAASYVDIDVDIPFDPNQSPQNDAHNQQRSLFGEHRRNLSRTLHNKKNGLNWRLSELSKFNMRHENANTTANNELWNYSTYMNAFAIATIFIICIVLTVSNRYKLLKLLHHSSDNNFESHSHRVTVTKADDFLHNEPTAVYQANSEWVWLGAKQLETGSCSRKSKPNEPSLPGEGKHVNPELTTQLLQPPSVVPREKAQCKFIAHLGESSNSKRNITNNPLADIDDSSQLSDSHSEDENNERMLDRLLTRTFYSSTSGSECSSHHSVSQSRVPLPSRRSRRQHCAPQSGKLPLRPNDSLSSTSSSCSQASQLSNQPPPVPPHRKESRQNSCSVSSSINDSTAAVNSTSSSQLPSHKTRHLVAPNRTKVLASIKDSSTSVRE